MQENTRRQVKRNNLLAIGHAFDGVYAERIILSLSKDEVPRTGSGRTLLNGFWCSLTFEKRNALRLYIPCH
jgi:uncharacterized protein YueI